MITACKRSLGQGNVFTPVCHSVHRGRHADPLDTDPIDADPLDAESPGCRTPLDANPPPKIHGILQDKINK